MLDYLQPYQILIISLLFWNTVSFCVTAADKRAAKRGLRRTPERRLLFFAAALGGVGVLFAFYTLRHKTKHPALLAGVWTLTIVTAVMLAVGVWFFG